MLELVDTEKAIAKDVYDKVFPDLEVKIGECQRAARAANVPVIIVFEGWDAAGKGTTINRLTQALDPRGFKVYPISAPNEDERLRPWLWRFWRALPQDGFFAIFDRSWYGRVLIERMGKLTAKREWQQAYEGIEAFERQLTDAGAVIVKFWLHISKGEQKRRLKRLEKNPATAWTVGKEEWKQHRNYEKWSAAVEETIERTSSARAPWTLVEATQARYVRIKVYETIIETVQAEIERRAAGPKPARKPMAEPKKSPAGNKGILDRLDMSVTMEREEYDRRIDELQKRLFELEHEMYTARVPAVIVYEGCDAGGKGGNIKRLTNGLDPRGYEVVPIAAPTKEELAHHYLWRFWKQLPKAGHITIYDRSWYGRILVERVEGFCTEEEWKRAFREINEYERQLAEFGAVIVKFWLHISQDEQMRRFKERQRLVHKQWKITDEDWRNRKNWSKYAVCIEDMLNRTSTSYAPWTILEANCKLHARVKALQTVKDALEAGLARQR
ncbi:MAG: phosphate--AMP phosphotransferase [Candidatus Sumerlaeota bacterium]|nr:phosphate--AMP phosphotransferase [Candidatus Sumerlaeota bacterium]